MSPFAGECGLPSFSAVGSGRANVAYVIIVYF